MEVFEQSEKITELAKKLLEFQKLDVSVLKNTENKFLKNKYADLQAYLEAVNPALNKVGLVLNQFPTPAALLTQITDPDTGQYFRCSYPLTLTGKTGTEIGSIISYGRRYSIAAVLNLFSEDDDNSLGDGLKESDVKNNPEKVWLNLPGKNDADKVQVEKLKAGVASGKYKTMSDIKKDWNVSVVVKDLIIKQYPNITPN